MITYVQYGVYRSVLICEALYLLGLLPLHHQMFTSQARPTAALTAWILRHGVIAQFSRAQEQLEAAYWPATLRVLRFLSKRALVGRCRGEGFHPLWPRGFFHLMFHS